MCNKTDEEIGPAEMLSVTQTLGCFFLLIDRTTDNHQIIISQCGMDEEKFQPIFTSVT